MRNRFIVSYDITSDRRRTFVYKTLRGFGDHIQYSVFRCDLSPRERIEMIAALHPLIDHDEDQILLIDLGPIEGRASQCITSLGRRYNNPESLAIVIE
jgi:CRISPR-associated protein Cas2